MSEKHLTWEELIEHCESAGDTVPDHFRKGCTMCEEKAAMIRDLLAGLEGNRLRKSPDALRARAEAMVLKMIGKDQVERLLAEIVFDSEDQRQLVASEREAALDERRLVFRAGEIEILLTITKDSSSTAELAGQIILSDQLTDELEGIPVILSGGGKSRSGKTDDLGGFHFTSISEGVYSLAVHLSGNEVAVEGIEIHFS